jgi:hypothetical protein
MFRCQPTASALTKVSGSRLFVDNMPVRNRHYAIVIL